jgi:hypothetical protein
MALSPNYGWAEPDNSSLVKNGAQDIRALGDAIDTSVWNVGYGQAGKNKIINGDFGIWQRGTTFSAISAGQYTSDRWLFQNNGTGTATITRETFTPGAAPVAGYESQYFIQMATNSVGTSTVFDFAQRIENVTTFANQTITISFWAKADSARTISPIYTQGFGTGGSSTVNTFGSAITLTTSWARYTQTIAIPSIAGKTIGTSSLFAILLRTVPASGAVVSLWGVQAEYGSKATPFQTASGNSPQGELAMCQRYYFRTTTGVTNQLIGAGIATTATTASVYVVPPVTMRVAPTSVDAANLATSDLTAFTNAVTAPTTIAFSTVNNVRIDLAGGSGMTAKTPIVLQTNGTAGYLGLSAEL